MHVSMKKNYLHDEAQFKFTCGNLAAARRKIRLHKQSNYLVVRSLKIMEGDPSFKREIEVKWKAKIRYIKNEKKQEIKYS